MNIESLKHFLKKKELTERESILQLFSKKREDLEQSFLTQKHQLQKKWEDKTLSQKEQLDKSYSLSEKLISRQLELDYKQKMIHETLLYMKKHFFEIVSQEDYEKAVLSGIQTCVETISGKEVSALKLRVSPRDKAFISPKQSQFSVTMDIVEDPTMLGGFILESSEWNYNFTLEMFLESMLEKIENLATQEWK